MNGVLLAETAGTSSSIVIGHIPTYVIGSGLYGVAFAIAFYGYFNVRTKDKIYALFGKPEPTEFIFVFLVTFLLCFSTSVDSVNTPWLIGLFAALCMAITTQHLLSEVADKFCVELKSAWFFAEVKTDINLYNHRPSVRPSQCFLPMNSHIYFSHDLNLCLCRRFYSF